MVCRVFTSGLIMLCFLFPLRVTAQTPKPVNPDSFTVPFYLIAGLVVVDAVVDGNDGLFIIDTGSEELMLNAAHVNRKMGSNTINDFSGNSTSLKTGHFSFSLGRIHFKQKRGFVVDLRHLESTRNIKILGLVGYSILKDYEILLDYDAKKLTFFEIDKKGNRLSPSSFQEEPSRTFPLKLRGHLACIELTVGQESFQAALDTGAGLNLFDEEFLESLTEYSSDERRANIKGLSRQQHQSITVKIEGVHLADIPCPPMRTSFKRLNHLNRYITGSQIDGLVGYEFLRHFKTLLNFRKKALSIWIKDAEIARK